MPGRLYLVIWLLLASPVCAQAAPRLPVPSDEAVASATKAVADVYKKDYEAAKTPAQKQVLAKRLLDDGDKTKDDATTRFAIYQVARKLAAQGGDVELGLLIADKLIAEFELAEAPLKAALLVDAGPNLRTPDQYYFYARWADRLTPALRSSARWPELVAISEFAETAAGKLRDADLAEFWKDRRKEFLALQKAYAIDASALVKLESSPADAEINLAAGRLKCFLLEDWSVGLPMLALGQDAALQKLAERELRSDTASDLVTLANDWSAYASTQERYDRSAVLRHAFALYKQAESKLEGLPKARARKGVLETFATGMPSRAPLAMLPFTNEGVAFGDRFSVMVAKVAGRPFPNTLWAHPPADGAARLAFDLPEGSKYLVGMCAFHDMDDRPHNSVLFRIVGDNNRELWRAPQRWQTLGQTIPFKVDVRGQKRLELIVECGGFNGASHAIWVEPLLQQ